MFSSKLPEGALQAVCGILSRFLFFNMKTNCHQNLVKCCYTHSNSVKELYLSFLSLCLLRI